MRNLRVSQFRPSSRSIPAPLMVTALATVLIVGLGAPCAFAQSSTSSTTSTSTSTSTTTSTSSTTSTTTTTTTTKPATTLATTTTTTTTIVPAVPGAPRNLAANLTGTAQVTVTWLPPESSGSQPLSGYKLVVLTIVGNSSTTSPPLQLAPTSTSYVLNDLRPNVAYAFYLRAENSVGGGPNTSYTAPLIVPGPTTTQPAAPAPVTNPQLSLLNGQLRVTWTPPSSTPTQIAHYRITTVPSLGTLYSDPATLAVNFNNARPGVTYLAQIFAVGINGKESAPNTTNAIAIPSVPTVPTTVRVPTPTVPPVVGGKPLPVQPPTPPGRPQPCVRTSWPKYVYGRPGTFQAGAPQGVYVWHDGRYWQVRVYNPGPGAVMFVGRIEANTRVSFRAYGLERNDALQRTSGAANFSFSSDYDIDSIRISASCATALRFTFTINGAPVPANRIFLGRNSVAPNADFTIVR